MTFSRTKLIYLGSSFAISAMTSACSIDNQLTGTTKSKSTENANDVKNDNKSPSWPKGDSIVSHIKQLFASKDSSLTTSVFNSPITSVFDSQRFSNLPAQIEILGVTLEGLDKWQEFLETQNNEITSKYTNYGEFLADRNISALPDLDINEMRENLLALKDIISRGPTALTKMTADKQEKLYIADIVTCLGDVGQTIWGAVNGTVGCVAPEISVIGGAITTATTSAGIATDTAQAMQGQPNQAMGTNVPYTAAVATHGAEAVPCVGGWIGMVDHGRQAAKDCKHPTDPFRHIDQRQADITSDYLSQALRD